VETPALDDPRYAGIARLYGTAGLARLRAAHVVVVGIGGVGGWAAEALARSGVGRLTLIDGDDVCVSNTNRQVVALVDTVGQPKAAVMAARIRAIDPACQVDALQAFVTPANFAELLPTADGVIDACDALKAKQALVVYCRRRKVPIVTVGAAGGRTDPTQIRVRDLSKTEHDKLLSLLRQKLRDDNGYTRNPKRYFGVPAVYSLEHPRWPDAEGGVCAAKPGVAGEAAGLDCGGGLGSATHVTGAFAFAAVATLIVRLTAPPKPPA